MEDEYERKEDMRRLDYQRRMAMILDKNNSFKNSVKQHGTFDPFRKTYGTDRKFAEKVIPIKQPAFFGPFRIGDLPKVGYNKTLGKNPEYMEDP